MAGLKVKTADWPLERLGCPQTVCVWGLLSFPPPFLSSPPTPALALLFPIPTPSCDAAPLSSIQQIPFQLPVWDLPAHRLLGDPCPGFASGFGEETKNQWGSLWRASEASPGHTGQYWGVMMFFQREIPSLGAPHPRQGVLGCWPHRQGLEPLGLQANCCCSCSVSKSCLFMTPWTAARQASLSFTISS